MSMSTSPACPTIARALEDLADPTNQILDVAGSSEREREEALAIVRGVLSPTGLAALATGSLPPR